jgi:hypothetical protein
MNLVAASEVEKNGVEVLKGGGGNGEKKRD